MRIKTGEPATIKVPEGAKKMRISVSKNDPGYMHIQFTPVNHPSGGIIPDVRRGERGGETEFVVKSNNSLNKSELITPPQSGLSRGKSKR